MFRRRASLRLGLCTRVARIMTVPPPQAAVSTECDAVFKARGAAGPAAPPGRCQLLSLSLSLCRCRFWSGGSRTQAASTFCLRGPHRLTPRRSAAFSTRVARGRRGFKVITSEPRLMCLTNRFLLIYVGFLEGR